MKDNFLKKYKPTSLEDFNISEFTKQLIKSYINNSTLLFIIHGNSISGKTTLINTILNLYYDNNINNNVLFFNLLKEQGINYYRNDLKNFCQINNINNKEKKTIIFDDMDLLNEQSQQIFSNLLMHYKNINFIFSCTDINKIQQTLLQRLEYIKIDAIDNIFLGNILNKLLDCEKININNDIKKTIIKISNYSIPNLINILDKMILLNGINGLNNINNDNIDELYLTSNILKSEFDNYIGLCKNKNYVRAINTIQLLYNNGYSVIDIIDEFFNYIKNFSDLGDDYKYKIIKILSNYINIFNNLHENNIELIFMTNKIIKILNN
tara:strand:- start:3475 stop:4443 length:969 start_codon:yes stop_codon:yes gene_type:complete